MSLSSISLSSSSHVVGLAMFSKGPISPRISVRVPRRFLSLVECGWSFSFLISSLSRILSRPLPVMGGG